MIKVEKRLDKNLIGIEEIEFNQYVLDEEIEMFQEYKDKKIIVDCEFSDDRWTVTNEISMHTLIFNFDQLEFNRCKKKNNVIGDYFSFINAVKSIVLIYLKSTNITSLDGYLKGLKRIIKDTKYFSVDNTNKINIGYITSIPFVVDFLNFYKGFSVDEKYYELMWHAYDLFNGSRLDVRRQRELPTFESMFKMDEIIKYFWGTCTPKQRETYYPIKIWWELTNQLPLRSTEFVIIPYDCIEEKQNKYYLKVRRTKLKGNPNDINLEHNIDSDYEINQVQITKKLYELIKEYRDIADRYELSQTKKKLQEVQKGEEQQLILKESINHNINRRFLFSYELYNKNKEFKYSENQLNYFGYNSFKHLLGRFTKEIVIGEFKLDIIDKNPKLLLDNQIELISPMDTRHYAFMNMVLNDIEVLNIKKIAGHKDIKSTLHYCEHIHKYVECLTYSMAKKIKLEKNREQYMELQKLGNSSIKKKRIKFKSRFEKEQKPYVEVEAGKCSNVERDLTICYAVQNNCHLCDKIFDERQEQLLKVKETIVENENTLKMELDILKRILKQNKKINNFQEQYYLQLNKIRSLVSQNAYLISENIL